MSHELLPPAQLPTTPTTTMTDPTPTELSPAEEAGELILAYRKGADEVPHPLGLAAALRAVADQVVPELQEPNWGACDYMQCDIELYTDRQRRCSAILAIVAELEGQVNG